MMRVPPGRLALAALGVLALAGCDSSEEVAVTGEGADAQGEIAGGTISDAMIPLEELRSSSPPVGGGDGDGSGSGAGDSTTAPSNEGTSSAGEGNAEPSGESEEASEAGEDAGD